jgi:hypothetical protein
MAGDDDDVLKCALWGFCKGQDNKKYQQQHQEKGKGFMLKY